MCKTENVVEVCITTEDYPWPNTAGVMECTYDDSSHLKTLSIHERNDYLENLNSYSASIWDISKK